MHIVQCQKISKRIEEVGIIKDMAAHSIEGESKVLEAWHEGCNNV